MIFGPVGHRVTVHKLGRLAQARCECGWWSYLSSVGRDFGPIVRRHIESAKRAVGRRTVLGRIAERQGNPVGDRGDF